MIRQMVRENYNTQMAMYTKDNGRTIKLMEEAVINMPMVLHMSENGKMTNSMVKEQKHGQMERNMKVSIMKERSMEKGH